MKKTFAFLLVLVLAGPATGLACDCCPFNEAGLSPASILTAHAGCCPRREGDRNRCEIERGAKPLLASPVTVNFQIHSTPEIFSTPHFKNQAFVFCDTGPPLFSSEIPLYLAHRVLRI